MFLHANFRPKFTLSLPADFAAYTRRWQLAQPSTMPFVDLMAEAGIAPDVDFELEVYKVTLCPKPCALDPGKPACVRHADYLQLMASACENLQAPASGGRRLEGMLPGSPPEVANVDSASLLRSKPLSYAMHGRTGAGGDVLRAVVARLRHRHEGRLAV